MRRGLGLAFVLMLRVQGYVVQPGDTCYGITSSQGLSLPQLIACNPFTFQSCDDLPGMLNTLNCFGSYKVQPDDTSCSVLASKFSMTLQSLINANPGLSCSSINPGVSILIPNSDSQTSGAGICGSAWGHVLRDHVFSRIEFASADRLQSVHLSIL
eukprot:TRINITY_DN5604_c0_g2_i1.p1 TRINITY_DN5604_c0_g2~~TRINITY_DN5604_c0_g2_i1.p1  ORF type:complete len:156 (+),score=12.77 TRINITY_DN5604_c0_g2_i1:276-743(+)